MRVADGMGVGGSVAVMMNGVEVPEPGREMFTAQPARVKAAATDRARQQVDLFTL